jgi:hypothetical protein
MVPIASEEYEAILPEGWADGDDIFNVASWAGGTPAADEQQADDGQEEVNEETEADTDEVPATEQTGDDEEPGDDGEEVPATEQTTARPKLKFSAQIDHKVQDVELDENDLPAIYQKAHVTDRVKARLAQAQPLLDKGNRLAKILGYESMDAMLDAAESSYRQGEIDRLTSEGVHPDVAQELVESRAQKAAAATPVEQADTDDSNGPRDFKGEVADLLKAHPELRGTQLPDEVVKACVVDGRSLAGAYEAYARKKTEAENRAVKAENKRLKQNADAARRAPVRGVSKGGATNTQPDDPFLIGFNSDRW